MNSRVPVLPLDLHRMQDSTHVRRWRILVVVRVALLSIHIDPTVSQTRVTLRLFDGRVQTPHGPSPFLSVTPPTRINSWLFENFIKIRPIALNISLLVDEHFSPVGV